METTVVAPTRLAERIDTLDVLRGVAICGILLMNIPFMGMIGERGAPPLPAHWNADWIAWGVQSMLFEGTMRGLFTMLFGAGMLLMLRRSETQGEVTPIDVWTRRCLALMALGVVQWGVLLWPGEILWCYGVTGLGLLAFRTARPRALLIAATAAMIGLTAYGAVEGHGRYARMAQVKPALAAKAAGRPLTDEQRGAIKAYEKVRGTLHPTPDAIAKETRRRTHWTVFGWSWETWKPFNLETDGWVDVLESLCFMLIGMTLFRAGILTGEAPRSTYATLMILGYGAGLALRVGRMTVNARMGFDLDLDQLQLWPQLYKGMSYEPARLLISLGHVGLIATLFRSGALGRATPLRALGRMALTVYTIESAVTSLLFYGLGYVGAFGFAQLMAIAASIWVGSALFCLLWLRGHAMGPMEALLRAVAYGTFRRRWRRAEATQAMAAAPAI